MGGVARVAPRGGGGVGCEGTRVCLPCRPPHALAALALGLALVVAGANSPLEPAGPPSAARSKGISVLHREHARLPYTLGLRGGSLAGQQQQGGASEATPVAPAALALQQELGRVTKEYVEERRRGGTEPARDLQDDIDAVIAKWTQTAVATPRTGRQGPRGTVRPDLSSPGSLR